MKAYKNSSMFQGIKQYFDERGIEWRRISEGSCYKFYRIARNGFYHYMTVLKCDKPSKTRSISAIHNHYIESDLFDDECC